MNPSNISELTGTVHADSISGASWTRWKPGGRGQVRFWLAVSRELLGEGYDVLLCAIEPKTAEEVARLEAQLVAGRTIHLVAQARRCQARTPALSEEDKMSVIFVAETCGLDGQPPMDAHKLGSAHRKHSAHGKMAAAGDVEPDLLTLSESK